MLQSIIINVIVFPLFLGTIIAILSSRFVEQKNFILALLVPIFACVIMIVLDGLPAFPPVRAIHKFPYIILGASLFFAVSALLKLRRNTIYWIIAFALTIALPTWWMGKSILFNNGHKATVVTILILLAIVGAFSYKSLSVKKAKPLPNVLPQAVFATSIAGALTAILGGYMGMLMFNAALAVMFGGYLLVTYIRYLKGNEQAFELTGHGALAMSWVSFSGIVVTAILAPKASALGLVLITLTLSALPLAYFYAPLVNRIPYALRPLLSGAIVAIPALAGIFVAGIEFAG
ncbi:hypothetical protein ACLBWZ_05925 [Brucellaceae bacterium C25G]